MADKRKEHAEKGNAAAKYNTARAYDTGTNAGKSKKGFPKDKLQAEIWYQKAAMQGHADAQYCLGLSYLQDLALSKKEGEAARWFQEAAEKEHAKAAYYLALCYEQGKGGVAKDEYKAFTWYKNAVSYGSSEAHFALLTLATKFGITLEQLLKKDTEARHKQVEYSQKSKQERKKELPTKIENLSIRDQKAEKDDDEDMVIKSKKRRKSHKLSDDEDEESTPPTLPPNVASVLLNTSSARSISANSNSSSDALPSGDTSNAADSSGDNKRSSSPALVSSNSAASSFFAKAPPATPALLASPPGILATEAQEKLKEEVVQILEPNDNHLVSSSSSMALKATVNNEPNKEEKENKGEEKRQANFPDNNAYTTIRKGFKPGVRHSPSVDYSKLKFGHFTPLPRPKRKNKSPMEISADKNKSASPPQESLSDDDLHEIGHHGERLVYEKLKAHYPKKYPRAEYEETDKGFVLISKEHDLRIKVRWYDKLKNRTVYPRDLMLTKIKISDDSIIKRRYYEVKTTTSTTRAVLHFTGNEFEQARRHKEKYILVIVYNVEKAKIIEDVYMEKIKNPIQAIMDGSLPVGSFEAIKSRK